jgi:hypothetical protein
MESDEWIIPRPITFFGCQLWFVLKRCLSLAFQISCRVTSTLITLHCAQYQPQPGERNISFQNVIQVSAKMNKNIYVLHKYSYRSPSPALTTWVSAVVRTLRQMPRKSRCSRARADIIPLPTEACLASPSPLPKLLQRLVSIALLCCMICYYFYNHKYIICSLWIGFDFYMINNNLGQKKFTKWSNCNLEYLDLVWVWIQRCLINAKKIIWKGPL